MERRSRASGKDASYGGSLEEANLGNKDKRFETKRTRPASVRQLICRGVGVCLLALLAYLLYQAFVADCVVDPVVKNSAAVPALVGPLSPEAGESMATAQLLFPELWQGPECTAWDTKGVLYTGTATGQLWKLDPSSDEPVLIGRTGKKACSGNDNWPSRECSHPAGIRLVSDHTLLICDTYAGLLSLSLNNGQLKTLVPDGQVIDGKPVRFANDLVVAPDGAIYFSHSTTANRDTYYYDILASRPTGRIIRHVPESGTSSVFLDNSYFTNGVELSHDEESLIVCETSMYRIKRVFIDHRAGQSEILVDNLPGFPDNVRRHPDGGYLVALAGHRSWITNLGDHNPAIRRLIINVLPYEKISKLSSARGMCVHVSDDGDIINSWHTPDTVYGRSSHCAIHDGHLYVGSYHYSGLLKQKLDKNTPKSRDE